MHGVLYLNNNGSRWVFLSHGKRDKMTWQTASGLSVTRTVIFYKSFGNFATCCINYKGKRIQVFPDTILKD